MTNQELSWEKSFDEKFRNGATSTERNNQIVSFIKQLLLQDRAEMRDIKVSWDISKGDSWVVQFWQIRKDGGMTLLTQLDKGSDDGGSFALTSLLEEPKQ